MNFSSGIGSAGVQGTDSNTTNAGYTTGMLGLSANPVGIGVLGMFGKNGSKVGQSRLGTAGAGVWADGPGFGLVATSDLNAVVAYNNHPSGATIYGENDTTSSTGLLFYATAPNVNSNGTSASCNINSHADLNCTGDATQSRSANGMVKALLFINPAVSAGIVSCFNSQLAEPAASTPPCGFGYTLEGGGDIIDLGFTITDRFVSATLKGNFMGGIVVCDNTCPGYSQLSPTQVSTGTYTLADGWATVPYYLSIY
jgi:hypothetical protein